MDRKSKIFLIAFGLLIAASVLATYYRIMVKRDYIIEAQADCDPAEEKCFVWQCDPESSEEGEACTGEADKDISYYKIIHRNASRIPLCDPNSEDCAALSCGENEPECEYILCDEENKADQGAECNNPSKYRKMEEEKTEASPSGQGIEGGSEAPQCQNGDTCDVATSTEKQMLDGPDGDTQLPQAVENGKVGGGDVTNNASE